MNPRTSGCLLLILVACGGDPVGPADGATPDGATPDGAADAAPDAASPDASVPPLEPGAFTVQVPSGSAPGAGLAVRVFHPATDQARYPAGAPVVVFAPGGHTPGSLPPATVVPPEVTEHGYVLVHFLMPGGRAPDASSSGAYDYRGPACQRALADVLRYVQGLGVDVDGLRLADRVPFVLGDNVGLVGSSNGGNLAITTLARHGAELQGLAWFAAWESPIGDQTELVELSARDGLLNPFYVAGTCTVTSCPWPGLAEALAFDPATPYDLQDPASGDTITLPGTLFIDGDGDGTFDLGEFAFSPLAGPGVVINGQHRPNAYTSAELALAVESEATRLFPDGAPPWLATRTAVEAFWADRDGSLVIGAAHASLPGLLVMSLGSLEDHVQRQPDHPHVRSHQRGWLEAGHAFVRLNPDAAYLAWLTGESVDLFPDNAAGEAVPYPGIESTLAPELADGTLVDPVLTVAAILELADRTQVGDHAPDLDAVLVP